MSGGPFFDPDWVVAPGETLREWLGRQEAWYDPDEHGIPADVMGRLLAGGEPLTNALADLLEAMTGISAVYWANMESTYRAGLAAGKRRLEP